MANYLTFVFAALFAVTVNAYTKSYHGYELIEIVTRLESDRSAVLFLQKMDETLDFWYEGMDSVHVFAPPEKLNFVKSFLDKRGVLHHVINDHIQKDIEVEAQRLAKKKAFDVNDFNTYEDISSELVSLAIRCGNNPGVNCEVISAGQSAQGREQWILKISKSGAGRKAVWYDATIHAREWLATATHMKIATHLVDDYNTDPEVQRLVDTYDWYLMPVQNPDGYAYSWSNDRMWRKNRTPNSGSTCIGTDLNRNFAEMWGNAGASTNACSETFRGSSAGSEPETQNVQTQARQLGPSLATSIHMHTYGQYWLIPWGSYANGGPGPACNIADDHDDMMLLAQPVANAIAGTYNTNWLRGNSCQTIYPASGLTMDYFKRFGGVKYTATPELRGGSFIVDKSLIQLSYNEIWNGFSVLFNTLPGLP